MPHIPPARLRLAGRKTANVPSHLPENSDAGPTEPRKDSPVDHPLDNREWVIDKLLRRGWVKDGLCWAFVKWYGYPARDGT